MNVKDLVTKLKSTDEYRENYYLLSSFDVREEVNDDNRKDEAFFIFLFVLTWDIAYEYIKKDLVKDPNPNQLDKIFKKIDSFQKILDLVKSGAFDFDEDNDFKNFVIFRLKTLKIEDNCYSGEISRNWSHVVESIKNAFLDIKMYQTLN